MYRVDEQAAESGLYRCTTCGVIIPITAGERLLSCPSRCPDPIWTFFNERSAPPPEARETIESFPALDLEGEPRSIPAGARLTGVHTGPQVKGSHNPDPSLAAFHFEGRVYFGSAQELFQKTKAVN